MTELQSGFGTKELTQRWDEHTSPARFAGSDETMDLIFVGKRKGEKVKLVRRSSTMREPFACVFRGKLIQSGEGSAIKGVFTKTVADYIFCLAVFVLLLYIQNTVNARGDDPYVINVLLVAWLFVSFLLLYIRRGVKRKYTDFLCDITGKQMPLFLSRSEKREAVSEQDDQP